MTSDTTRPGAARARGPSVSDTLATDSRAVPPPLTQQRYEFLGDGDIPCSRYTSRDFAELEVERLWSRCWQWM